MKKKTQINQIFVYILSIIIIVFVGFLVTKFIISFTSTAQERAEAKIYTDLQRDFQTVYRTYGSEKTYTYKVSSKITEICLIQTSSCIQDLNLPEQKKEELNTIITSKDNAAIFDQNGIISSNNIGTFKIKEQCLCLTPKNGYFTLNFENIRNEVWINQVSTN